MNVKNAPTKVVPAMVSNDDAESCIIWHDKVFWCWPLTKETMRSQLEVLTRTQNRKLLIKILST